MQFSADIVIYLLSLAFAFGGLWFRVGALEKKMEVHNNVVKGLIEAQKDIKQLQERLDLCEKGRGEPHGAAL